MIQVRCLNGFRDPCLHIPNCDCEDCSAQSLNQCGAVSKCAHTVTYFLS